jgi:hypothetical protein
LGSTGLVDGAVVVSRFDATDNASQGKPKTSAITSTSQRFLLIQVRSVEGEIYVRRGLIRPEIERFTRLGKQRAKN